MKTFENYPGGKEAAIRDAKLHIEQDRLIRGEYYRNGTEDWRGCSIGCDVQTGEDPHEKWAEKFGTPEWFPHLVDLLFERLPEPEHIDWHLRVRQAMPDGVYIAPIRHKLIIRRLTRLVESQRKSLEFINDDHKLEAAIMLVIDALEQVIYAHRQESEGVGCLLPESHPRSISIGSSARGWPGLESHARTAARSAYLARSKSLSSIGISWFASASAESAARSAAEACSDYVVHQITDSAWSAANSQRFAMQALEYYVDTTTAAQRQALAQAALSRWRREADDLIELLNEIGREGV